MLDHRFDAGPTLDQHWVNASRFIVKIRLTKWVQLDLERLWLDVGPIVFVGLVLVHRAYLFDKIVFSMSARIILTQNWYGAGSMSCAEGNIAYRHKYTLPALAFANY